MTAIQTTGKRAALWATVFAIAYLVPQILSVLHWLPHPQDLFWMFLPSLLLAPAFVVTMICLHYTVTAEVKIYTAAAIAFATIYCVLVSLVYFTQLVTILPQLSNGTITENHILAFSGNSFMVAADTLGYTFMNLSTLFAAFAFYKSSSCTWLYRSLLFNGLLTPVMVLAFFIPFFLIIGALWMFTFPAAMVNAFRFFNNKTHYDGGPATILDRGAGVEYPVCTQPGAGF